MEYGGTVCLDRNGPILRENSAVAYRLLGSLSEADDAVQEAWLHLRRSDTSNIKNLGGCHSHDHWWQDRPDQRDF
jgi:Sigma-70 region 2